MRPALIPLLGLTLLSGPLGASVRYASTLEAATWGFSADTQSCALAQTVPRYGRATFTFAHGQGMHLRYETDLPLHKGVAGALYALPTDWGGAGVGEELAAAWMEPGHEPLVIKGVLAQRVWRMLEQGRMIRLEYVDPHEAGGTVQVDLLPLRFGEAASSFLTCGAGLIRLDFEPVAEWRIHFPINLARTSRGQQADLRRIAASFKAEPEGTRIVLGGHADARGEPGINRRIAGQRAEAVRDQLVRLGVPAKAIRILNFSADWSLDPADNAEAWAQNRRVTVWFAR